MKIDLEMLERIVATGATGAAVLAVVRLECERYEAARAGRRPADKARKQRKAAETKRTKVETVRKAVESGGTDETATDTPRARLFREGVPDLIALNIAAGRSRSLIGSWLKVTRDDEQLVTVTIRRARDLGVADAPGWILAALQQAMSTQNGQRSGDNRTNPASGQSGSAAIIAGVATAAERRGRERGAGRPGGGQAPQHADAAKAPDLELFGAVDG